MPETWSLLRESGLHVRGWPDEDSGIAFDERSGDTFVLTPLAMELLALLGESAALSADAIAARLSCGLAPGPDGLAGAVAVELDRLQARGLVVRHPS